uniref:Uncharacterized protein n=1 Tax=Hucho hucho TaxID=62062 RepID=A0A4W5RH19_9TELE
LRRNRREPRGHEQQRDTIEDTTVGIYIFKDHAATEEPEDTGIVLEGVKVLQDLGNVAFAVAMLFSLISASPFEVFQKVFIELNGEKLSNKAVAFKNSELFCCVLCFTLYV